ncbi:MAG: hypothetical protein IT204_15315 [Fimbriimonadaceae bacterium]|nr:hypothetical protein [Fimbriimonadaceae bacterium]
MDGPRWAAAAARGIARRVVIELDLRCVTPLHLGNGDADPYVDLPLLRDPLEGVPLLQGTTLAGALRQYLTARLQGYASRGPQPPDPPAVSELFGGAKGDPEGDQSCLILDDARAAPTCSEQRPGVRLEAATRTAADQALYNLDLWPAGTTFGLRCELLVPDGSAERDLSSALVGALAGLSDGSIRLGLRKSRGFGQVVATNPRCRTFDLRRADGLAAWLRHGGEPLTDADRVDDLAAALETGPPPDQRARFVLDARFAVAGSLLIRSASGGTGAPDLVQLQSGGQPVLSGTSLAGALRGRAQRIANTLYADRQRAAEQVEAMFGPQLSSKRDEDAWQSRVVVDERLIAGGCTDRVQHRVSLDRFTGGSLEAHLFNEQPVFANAAAPAQVQVHLELRNPRPAEIGLLLQVLKDLWTGDLPLGGEVGVGRGRLQGSAAGLELHPGPTRHAELRATGAGELTVAGDRTWLEDAAAALLVEAGKETADVAHP